MEGMGPKHLTTYKAHDAGVTYDVLLSWQSRPIC